MATITGTTGNDILNDLPGSDIIDALDGDDIIYVYESTTTSNGNQIDGGDGYDILSFENATGGVDAGPVGAAQGLINNIEGIEEVQGSAYDDFFYGDANSVVTVFGNDGDDSFYGSNGADFFIGGSGNDSMSGRGGDDILFGEDGIDDISGGDGNDLLFGGSGDDDKVAGGNGDDIVFGGAGNDKVHGGKDDDMVFGGSGLDKVYGQGGNDIIYGGSELDTIYAGSGEDIIYGDEGDDRIYAQAGDDILYGGAGNDRLEGGTDADLFVFGDNSGEDIISDFEVGVDTISLEDVSPIYWVDLPQEAKDNLPDTILDQFRDPYSYSDLTIVEVDGDSLVYIDDTNWIKVNGVTGLTESDFIFA